MGEAQSGGAAPLKGGEEFWLEGGVGRAVVKLMEGLGSGAALSSLLQQVRRRGRAVLEVRMWYTVAYGQHIIIIRPEPKGEEYRALFPQREGEERVRVTLRSARFAALVFRRWGRVHDGVSCLLAAAMSGAPFPALAPRVAALTAVYFPAVVFDRFTLFPGFGRFFSRDVHHAFLRLGWHRVGFAVRGSDEEDLRRAFAGLHFVGTDGMGNNHYFIDVTFPGHERLRLMRKLERMGLLPPAKKGSEGGRKKEEREG